MATVPFQAFVDSFHGGIVQTHAGVQSPMHIVESAAPRFHGFGLISRFLSSTCTEVSGVENIGQCGRLSALTNVFNARDFRTRAG